MRGTPHEPNQKECEDKYLLSNMAGAGLRGWIKTTTVRDYKMIVSFSS